MPRKLKKRVVYRDKKTGRLVSRATWTRSRTHGGSRFKRENLKRRDTGRLNARPTTRPRPRKAPRKHISKKKTRKVKRRGKARRKSRKKTEYSINVKYEPQKGKKVDVQIAAIGPSNRTRRQVLDAVEAYLVADENEEDPKWKIKIKFWEKAGRKYAGNDQDAKTRLLQIFYESELEVEDRRNGRVLG